MNHTCVSEAKNLTMDPLGGHAIWEVVLIVIVTGPLSFITILGNLLVVVSFRVNIQLRTISNYFLLSLAVADLILGAVSMNLYTAYIIMGRWTLGQTACDLWLALDYVASNASVMNLLVISFDRYFSVTRPLTYRTKRTPKRAAVMIALAWLVSFVLWGPAILFWPHVVGRTSVQEDKDCSIPFLAEPVLTYGTAIAAFYLPVSIMIILYCRIYWEIDNRAKGLAGFLGSVSSSGLSDGSDKQPAYPNGKQTCPSCSKRKHAGKGCVQSRKGPTGCFPKRRRLSPPATQSSVAATPPGEGSYMEAYSSSRCNAEDEDEDGFISSSTEEEREQDLRAMGSNPAVIKLRDLQDKSDETRESPAQRHTGPSGSPPCRRPSLRISSHHKQPKSKRGTNTIIREKKAARTLSAILLAFILTWTPYNIMVLASISYPVPEKLWQLGYWLCYVNSTVNPVCYALCNESFRFTFKALLLCRHKDIQSWDVSRRTRHSVRLQKSCSTV